MSEDLPEWFVNIILDFHNEFKKDNNLERFKAAGSATMVETMSPDLHIKGYAILDVVNPNNFTIIGKRTEPKKETHTEFFKHTACLPQIK